MWRRLQVGRKTETNISMKSKLVKLKSVAQVWNRLIEMKKLNDLAKKVIESENKIDAWLTLSHACKQGTLQFLRENGYDLNSSLSRKEAERLLKRQSYIIIYESDTMYRFEYELLKRFLRIHEGYEGIGLFNRLSLDSQHRLKIDFLRVGFGSGGTLYPSIYAYLTEVFGKEVEMIKNKQEKRKQIKFIKSDIDKKIRLYKLISGSDLPLKLAHSVCVKEGWKFLPTLNSQWEVFKKRIKEMDWATLSLTQSELGFGRDRKYVALGRLGFNFPTKDPNYTDLGAIRDRISLEMSKNYLEFRDNFCLFVDSDKELIRLITDPWTFRRPASVLADFCEKYGYERPSNSVGELGELARSLYEPSKTQSHSDPDRADLVAPATGHKDCVRDDAGHIVSVPGFVR